MKKVFAIISLVLFSYITMNATSISPSTNESQLEEVNPQATWTVTVTYTIWYQFYEDEYYSIFVGEEKQSTETAVFTESAATQDEAESLAKQECWTVCSNNSKKLGKQPNKKTGKYYYTMELRRVESARANVKF